MPVFYAPTFDPSSRQLPPDESKHASRVLRMQVGDELEVVDGRGTRYLGSVSSVTPKEVIIRIDDAILEAKRSHHLHLAIAPTKNRDRIEWLVEKAVEIGVERITLLQADHSERAKINLDRLQRIMVSAMKQSKRSYLPELIDLTPTLQFWPQAEEKEKYIAHCAPGQKATLNDIDGRDCVIAIGPEGDFSEQEIKGALAGGFAPLHLGDMRLRTETAGLLSCAAVALKVKTDR